MTDLEIWLCLTLVTVLTSAVSGVVGMIGGSLLLAAMLLALPPTLAIPIHGVVQMVSNASRAWIQRRHVRWRLVWYFVVPLVPAAWLGVRLARSLHPAWAAIGVGVFLLTSQFAPKVLAPLTKPRTRPQFGMLWGGALIGGLSPLVGATGSLLAPFVLAFELGREATIGTLAACQVFQHASKVVAFGASGFDFARYALPALGLCVAAVCGSALGARLLDRIDEARFKRWIRVVLVAVAAKVFWDAGVMLWQSG